MSKIEEKLKQNRDRRRRECLIELASNEFRPLLGGTTYTSDVKAIKYAAFSTWNIEKNIWTTTRGDIETFRKLDFQGLEQLIQVFTDLPIGPDVEGWFFFDDDGPYYSLRFGQVVENIESIQEILGQQAHFEFGWVGSEVDTGAIVEFEKTGFCKNDFTMCYW
ncbi:hypothetical protein A9R10_03540 [Aeromonas piscicola]|nr:hypothetical protein A9R10_03540 [Aeromonas piscicola]